MLKDSSVEVKTILKDIDNLLTLHNFEHSFITKHILNKLIQLTCSSSGFIALVENENKPYLCIYAICNESRNQSSFDIYMKHIYHEQITLPIESDTLYGKTILQNKVIVDNSYNYKKNILPDNIPIKKILGVPIQISNKAIGLVILKNKISDFTEQDIESVQKILNSIKYLFINIRP